MASQQQQQTAAPIVEKVFGQEEFKKELGDAAAEHRDTAGYQFEEHKLVAKDAAAMALSKSEQFAKACESEGSTAAGEGIMTTGKEFELLKEQLGETMDHAKDAMIIAKDTIIVGLQEAKEKTGEALDATKVELAKAYDISKEKTALAYDFSKEKTIHAYEVTKEVVTDIVEGVVEKTGEALEFVGEKMKEAGTALEKKGETIEGQAAPAAPSNAPISV